MTDAVVVLWLPVLQLCDYLASAYNFGKGSKNQLIHTLLYRDTKATTYRCTQIVYHYISNS